MRKIPPVKEIRGVCQPRDLDLCVSRRLFTRPVSIYFTRFFLVMGISADTVSALKGIIACTGSLMFLPGTFSCAVAGAFLLQLSFILDASDGEVARYTGSCESCRGEFIDKLGDTASRGLFYGAWGIALFNRTGEFLFLPAGMVMAGVWLTVRFCAVETVLESFSNHLDTPPSPGEMNAVSRLFVRQRSSGMVEFFLSRFYHPWINIAVLAAASSFHTGLFSIVFTGYFTAWFLNTLRKIIQGMGVTSFKRPAP